MKDKDLLVEIAEQYSQDIGHPAVIRYQYIRENAGRYSDNILTMLEFATSQDLADGLAFYGRARSFCETLANSYSLTLAETAGIMAILSVENSIEKNMQDTSNLLALGEMATVSTYDRQKYLAIAVAQGMIDPFEALAGRGNGKDKKTYSFWDNIMRPHDSERVTLDRHAIRIAVDQTMTAKLAIRYAKTAQKYRALSLAYTRAAAQTSYRPLDLQSIVWHTFRRLFVTIGTSKTLRNQNAIAQYSV